MEAEPSGFNGLPIVLMGLFILTMAILGNRAAKKRKDQSSGSGSEGGVSFAGDGDSGGDCGGGGD